VCKPCLVKLEVRYSGTVELEIWQGHGSGLRKVRRLLSTHVLMAGLAFHSPRQVRGYMSMVVVRKEFAMQIGMTKNAGLVIVHQLYASIYKYGIFPSSSLEIQPHE
jgi:hypothetical protein